MPNTRTGLSCVVASRDGGGHGLDVCGVGTEEVSNALREKETWRNKAKNESQEERKFSSSDSLFFLRQKNVNRLRKIRALQNFIISLIINRMEFPLTNKAI